MTLIDADWRYPVSQKGSMSLHLTFLKAKKTKKKHFEGLLSGRGYYLVQVECVLKKRKLGPDNNPWFFCAQLFCYKTCAETPIFIVFCDKQCFFLNKLGPDNNPSQGRPDQIITPQLYFYMYVYVYIYISIILSLSLCPCCSLLLFPRQQLCMSKAPWTKEEQGMETSLGVRRQSASTKNRCLHSLTSPRLAPPAKSQVCTPSPQEDERKQEGFGTRSYRSRCDCKRGRRKGATSKNVKNSQKASKRFSTLFDNFRAGQKTSKIVKKRQKYFRHFSTIFARHQFSGPFWGALKK